MRRRYGREPTPQEVFNAFEEERLWQGVTPDEIVQDYEEGKEVRAFCERDFESIFTSLFVDDIYLLLQMRGL